MADSYWSFNTLASSLLTNIFNFSFYYLSHLLFLSCSNVISIIRFIFSFNIFNSKSTSSNLLNLLFISGDDYYDILSLILFIDSKDSWISNLILWFSVVISYIVFFLFFNESFNEYISSLTVSFLNFLLTLKFCFKSSLSSFLLRIRLAISFISRFMSNVLSFFYIKSFLRSFLKVSKLFFNVS